VQYETARATMMAPVVGVGGGHRVQSRDGSDAAGAVPPLTLSSRIAWRTPGACQAKLNVL